jgi:hypothetical protein
MEIPKTVREGHVVAKACKTDKVFQRFAVEQWDNGQVVFYSAVANDWCSTPSEWRDQIVWDRAFEAVAGPY